VRFNAVDSVGNNHLITSVSRKSVCFHRCGIVRYNHVIISLSRKSGCFHRSGLSRDQSRDY